MRANVPTEIGWTLLSKRLGEIGPCVLRRLELGRRIRYAQVVDREARFFGGYVLCIEMDFAAREFGEARAGRGEVDASVSGRAAASTFRLLLKGSTPSMLTCR